MKLAKVIEEPGWVTGWSGERFPAVSMRFDALVAAIDSDEWGAHEVCSLVACRAPLHPGPCKGWKHTLHLVSPGAWKTLEKARVEKLNNRRLAKVAQLKAQGKVVPPALLKPIEERAHPGAPPPGWRSGDLAPGQPAADAAKVAATPSSKVGQKAAHAKGPAHKAGATLAQHAAQAKGAPAGSPAGSGLPAAPAGIPSRAGYNLDQRGAVNASRHRSPTAIPAALAAIGRLSQADYNAMAKDDRNELHTYLSGVTGPRKNDADALRSRLEGWDKAGVVAKTAAPAVASPLSSPAIRAAAAAARGTAKAKLEAYGKLDKADFDGLPAATQAKIRQDLTLMRGKFLAPDRQREVDRIQGVIDGKPAAGAPQVVARPAASSKFTLPSYTKSPAEQLDAMSKLDKATFDAFSDQKKRQALLLLDRLGDRASGLPDADRQRAKDLHTSLRGAPATSASPKPAASPVAPAGPPAAPKVSPSPLPVSARKPHEEVLHRLRGRSTPAEVAEATGALSHDDAQELRRQLDSSKKVQLTAALKAAGRQDLNDALFNVPAHNHGDFSLAEVAAARKKVQDALEGKTDREILDNLSHVTLAEATSLDPLDLRTLSSKLDRIAFKSNDRGDEHRADAMMRALAPMPAGAKPADTLGKFADERLAGVSKSVNDRVDATLKNLRSGQVPLVRAQNELADATDASMLPAAQQDAFRQRLYDLGKTGTDLPPAVRARLALEHVYRDSSVPQAVRDALVEAANPTRSISHDPIGKLLGATPSELAKVEPWLRDAIYGGLNDKIRMLGMATPQAQDQALIHVAKNWQRHKLASVLDKTSRDELSARADKALAGSSGRLALAGADLKYRMAGKDPDAFETKVGDVLAAIENGQVDALAARQMEAVDKKTFDSLPADYKAVLTLGAGNLAIAQRANPTAHFGGAEPKAGEILARWAGTLPNYSTPYVNRAVIDARFNAPYLPPGELLRNLLSLDKSDVDGLDPGDRSAVLKELEALADKSRGGRTLDTSQRYDAQFNLDDFSGQTSKYPDKPRALAIFADPTAPPPESQFMAAAALVSKQQFDSLPEAYRDAITERLREYASAGGSHGHEAQTTLARFGTPLPAPSPATVAKTTSSDPVVNDALDAIYGVHPKATTSAHQLAVYSKLTPQQFGQLNPAEQAHLVGDLAYIASSSQGPNAAKAKRIIDDLTPPGTPLGTSGTWTPVPPPNAVQGQTHLPDPGGAAGLLKQATDKGASGDGWVRLPSGGTGPWGKYGAAGLMLAHVGPDGKRRFLMVQRGPGISDPGKWQFPGGAIDSKETPYQGATREVLEELGFPAGALDSARVHGYHEAKHPDVDWAYTSIAATVPTQLVPDLSTHHARQETSDAKWMTLDEIRQLDTSGKLLKPLAGGALERNVVSLFPPVTVGATAAAKKQPRLAIPKATAHKQVRGRDHLATTAERDALRQKVKQTKGAYEGKTADARLAAIAHEQGFDDTPTVVSKAEMDRLLATGDYIEAWRGVSANYGTGKSARDINEDFRSGAAYFGKGIFGNGYYLATQKRVAEGYSDGTRGSLIRVLIPKSALTQTHEKVRREADQVPRASKAKGAKGWDESTLWDEGRYAAARGLDGIEIPIGQRPRSGHGSGHVAAPGKPAYNWLNRAILIVEEG